MPEAHPDEDTILTFIYLIKIKFVLTYVCLVNFYKSMFIYSYIIKVTQQICNATFIMHACTVQLYIRNFVQNMVWGGSPPS